MKKNFLVAFISILIISTMAYATSYVIHDYDTGVMHMAQDIYLTNTNSVQTQIDSIETNLNGSYALKSGTLSQFTGGTNLNQIATRNHSDLQNINGSESYQHLTTAEVANITLKSGSITQIITRNHNDLQNLNASSAHPSASIDNTSTSYGRGLATTDNTVQKIADRVNQNGTPQFVTDKNKCSLLLDFKGTLADRSRAINPIGSDAANKWVDNYVNDSTTKTSATNISCTLKQFEGDEGLFGSGVAVEESRTNLLTYSDDLTNAAWIKTNCTVTLDRILPDGRKLFKVTAVANGDILIRNPQTYTNGVTYSESLFLINTTGKQFCASATDGVLGINSSANITKLTKLIGSRAGNSAMIWWSMYLISATAGDTFYITSPQLEAGAFPTSYIATGATAVTRPAGKVYYPKELLNNISEYTLSFWLKPNFNYDTPNNKQIFAIYSSSLYWVGQYDSAFDIFSFYFGGFSYAIRTSVFTDNVELQKIKHIVIKQSKNNASVYIDKILIGSINYAQYPLKSDEGLILGGVGSEQINGTISNFTIFNYALSDAEISQIYNSGLEGKPIVTTTPESIIGVGQTLHDPNFITFTSGWGISSTYPNKPTLSKSSNVALMRGILEYSGVVNSDVTIFTLPAGARPSLPDTYYHSFVTTARDSGSPAMRILRVYGNGDVKLMANGATITNPAISLDNINFVNGK